MKSTHMPTSQPLTNYAPHGINAVLPLRNTWLETLLLPVLTEIERYARQAAREEYKSLLAERTANEIAVQQHDELLTVQQAARVLGVRPQTAYDWIKVGKLKANRIGGRALRLKHGQVMAVLQELTQPDGRRKYARRA
ncbi:helix-turn-helix domain-containing protein [Hymenobacter ruber]